MQLLQQVLLFRRTVVSSLYAFEVQKATENQTAIG